MLVSFAFVAFLRGQAENKNDNTVCKTSGIGQKYSLVVIHAQLEQLELQEQEAKGYAAIAQATTVIQGEVTNLSLEFRKWEVKSFQIWYPEKNTVKMTKEVIERIMPILEKCDNSCTLKVKKGFVVSADDEAKDTQPKNENKTSRLN